MEEWVKLSTDFFNDHVNSFTKLTEEQVRNFTIKKEHSFRVAEISEELATTLQLGNQDRRIARLAGLFHDMGRFKQLVDYNTFNDSQSVDHAEFSAEILKREEFLQKIDCHEEELIYTTISLHNKFDLPKKLSERQLLHTRLLRDADKLDIFKVLTDYYTNLNSVPNHTLTWELPKGIEVSPAVKKAVLAGKLVAKRDVASEIDVKIMQLSWVYDINFKPTFEYLLKNRFLEKIYNTLPKKDIIIDIYRKVKVFAENKLLD
jgi:putative nucleotidyltransferase with HDIG domain